MAEEYPEFSVRLPNGGPTARGRQTDELGTHGSQKFFVPAGQPVRPDVSPNFARHGASSYRLREQLVADGRIRPSGRWHGEPLREVMNPVNDVNRSIIVSHSDALLVGFAAQAQPRSNGSSRRPTASSSPGNSLTSARS